MSPLLMNDDDRPDPDALLAQLQREESLDLGRLFILLGMCPRFGNLPYYREIARFAAAWKHK